MWQLNFMANGKKYVHSIPKQHVDEILPLVEAGREYKDAVAEVFAINAQLLVLRLRQDKKERRASAKRSSTKPAAKRNGPS